jgi:mRNA interferase RelE/StbE
MKAIFLAAFARDLRRIADKRIGEQVRSAIEAVEGAPDLRGVSGLKKLHGTGPYFRIRAGEYRIGVRVDGDTVTFMRVLPRKDIYRYFP